MLTPSVVLKLHLEWAIIEGPVTTRHRSHKTSYTLSITRQPHKNNQSYRVCRPVWTISRPVNIFRPILANVSNGPTSGRFHMFACWLSRNSHHILVIAELHVFSITYPDVHNIASGEIPFIVVDLKSYRLSLHVKWRRMLLCCGISVL